MRRHRPVVEVPDVVGLGADDACAIVRRAGLVPAGPEGMPAPAEGVVVAQAPIGTAGAEEGTTVVLITQHGRRPADDPLTPPPTEEADTLQPA